MYFSFLRDSPRKYRFHLFDVRSSFSYRFQTALRQVIATDQVNIIQQVQSIKRVKIAMCVGNGDYSFRRGCRSLGEAPANDALNMQTRLNSYGFETVSPGPLVNCSADAILSSIQSMISLAEESHVIESNSPPPLLLFYFSGHWTWIRAEWGAVYCM